MDYDLFLVIGIVLGILAVPSLLGAYSENRPPRAAAVMLLVAGSLIATALMQAPQGYTFADIPDVFARVIGRYVN